MISKYSSNFREHIPHDKKSVQYSFHVIHFPGFKWQRQLVFCSKLTMHTAYERKDNKEPAAVSAIAVSK